MDSSDQKPKPGKTPVQPAQNIVKDCTDAMGGFSAAEREDCAEKQLSEEPQRKISERTP